MPTCRHQRRLWLLSPGPRVACAFAFCDDCATKLFEKEVTALVKERWPDRPVQHSFGEEPPDKLADGWQLACATGWVTFLYPGALVNALWERGKVGIPPEHLYRSWLPETR